IVYSLTHNEQQTLNHLREQNSAVYDKLGNNKEFSATVALAELQTDQDSFLSPIKHQVIQAVEKQSADKIQKQRSAALTEEENTHIQLFYNKYFGTGLLSGGVIGFVSGLLGGLFLGAEAMAAFAFLG